MENKKKRTSLLRILGTVITLVLLVYLLREQGWDSIVAAIRQIPLSTLALAFALVIGSRFAVISRWHILMRATELKIPYLQTVRITFAGLFASNFLPTTVGGDVIRLAGAVRLGYDAALSTASLITDRLVGMAGMAIAVPWGLSGFFQLLNEIRGDLSSRWYLFAAVLPAPQPSFWRRLWEKGLAFLQQLLQALKVYFKKPFSLVYALFFTAIHMICIFTALYLLFQAEGEKVSWPLIAGLYSLVYFITLLPVSINGYGLQEISMTYIFTHVAGTSIESSLSVALLLRTMTMVASLPGAFFVPGIIAGESMAEVKPDQE